MRIKLKDAFELQIGKTPSRNKSEYWNGVYKWVSISDIGNSRKYVYSTRESITDKGIIDSGIKVIPKGTVIMSFKLSIGKTAITTEDMYTNEAIVAFIDKKKIPIDIDYMYYLCSGSNWMQGVNKAVMGLTLNKATLSEKEINIPNIEIQKKCACNLDKIDRIIDLKKQQLDQLDLLARSLFIEMFGDIHNNKNYDYTNIEEITSVLSGGTPDRKENKYWEGGTINWVKTTELNNNIIIETEEKITNLGLENSSAKIIPPQSILIAMYGQGKTRGMTGYLEVSSATNQACACILPSIYINQKYLWNYLILSYDKLRNMAKGGNQPNLNVMIIKKFPVLIPPMNLQEKFVQSVSSIDKSKLAVKKSLEELEVLKKSLMQKYFA